MSMSMYINNLPVYRSYWLLVHSDDCSMWYVFHVFLVYYTALVPLLCGIKQKLSIHREEVSCSSLQDSTVFKSSSSSYIFFFSLYIQSHIYLFTYEYLLKTNCNMRLSVTGECEETLVVHICYRWIYAGVKYSTVSAKKLAPSYPANSTYANITEQLEK